ncbi:type IV pilus assembly protein PilX [Collimonas sp. OK307]|uniref:pilus assembly PilX family protein n=1 Tax=Collimonas sp. OK307 TaxID=1801620 RepID=UPI0008ED4A40|nr:PilX N-terminal domain-containing pilus assembly protein [Collimonas sp. OK307]SFH73493.1 type IV pilus assembly protein PilX [Collimonas sp. OK307]
MKNFRRQLHPQSGLVLPMVLIFLMVMMLIGFTALRAALLEAKMAANAGNRQMAFQAAEHALRFCGNQLQLSPITIPQLKQGPIPVDGANSKPYWEIADSWSNSNVSVAMPRIGSEGAAAAMPARCLVEKLQFDGDLQYQQHLPQQRPAYRVTARGIGASTAAVVVLQSYLLL